MPIDHISYVWRLVCTLSGKDYVLVVLPITPPVTQDGSGEDARGGFFITRLDMQCFNNHCYKFYN